MSVTAASAARAADHPRHPGSVMAGNITRSLLGYLALAGPFYLVVSLVQALTRDGFSLVHDEWSLLAAGHLGWIQTVNLILTGAMTVAGAVGFRRAVGRSATAGRWAPRLLASYGIALIGAGIFRADAAGIASGAGNAAVNLAFTAAVIASSAWLTAVAVDLYRRTRHDEQQVAEVAR